MTFSWSKLRQWGGNVLFTLFFLVLMLDPTGTVLSVKDKVFALLVAYNLFFFRPSFRFFPHIVIVYVAVTCSFISGQLQGNEMDMDLAFSIYKAFIPLILLLWAHHYDFVRLTLIPALITALVVCAIYWLCSYDERLEGIIYEFMKAHDDMVMMSHRYLLGVKVFGIYYKSFVTLSFALFWFYYKIYNDRKRWYLTIFPVLIMTFAFLVSGTRATMLLPFFVMALVGYRSIGKLRRWKYAFYPALVLFALAFLVMIFVFASEKTESSNVVKYAHLTSFKDLFEQHPLYLLVGQGIGTRFYTIGFHSFTNKTEWTYLELLRQYGLFCLPILFTLLYPLRQMWRQRSDSFCFGIMGTYVAYLLVAGTNPLLISSTGMILVLCAYSFISRLDEKTASPAAPPSLPR
ncbi:MAG: hypothetical protein LUI09_02215 [Prevotellaceae bacterium]|nr:hypothetical protein [Prevotellaceae bacterium]